MDDSPTHLFGHDYSQYYDLMYGDKDYAAEVKYLVTLFSEFQHPFPRILEYGCGTGNHARELQALGYTVTGVERSARMAEFAKEKGVSVIITDISTAVLEPSFDVCLAMFHVMSYYLKDEDVVDVLRKTKALVGHDGLFIFDVWYTPAVTNLKPQSRVKVVENETISLMRTASPTVTGNNTVNVKFDFEGLNKYTGEQFSFCEDHHMRHFEVEEIERCAEVAGFKVVLVEELVTRKAPAPDTWGVTFVLRSI